METPEIKLLYQPKDEITADLLFINGIGRNWERSWRCTTNHDATWIRDQLPYELPFLRMGCWVGTVNTLNRLIEREVREIADEFLKNLQAFRNTMPSRPIIFVAHSLGGVVLKQALVKVAESTDKSLLRNIAGILFLSVPTNFSPELWRKFLSRVYAPNKAANSFTKKNASPGFIADIQTQFGKLLEKKPLWNPEIYSLYETLPTYGTGVIVDAKTANISGYDLKCVAANHLSITILDRETDPLYDWVCDWLKTVSFRRDKEAISKPEADLPSEAREPLVQVKNGPDIRDRILDQVKIYPEAQREILYALLMEDEGLYTLEESSLKAAIEICQKDMKIDHPVALFCRDRLVHNYRLQGKYEDARNECRAIMKLRQENSLSDQHGMLATVKNEALILRSESKPQEAWEILVKSLETTSSTETSTSDHLSTFHLLASLLNDLGYHKFSEILSRAVIEEYRLRLGPKHPYTLECMSDLAVVFAVRGNARKANKYHLLAYEGLESRYGINHPAVLCVFRRYAMAMLYQGKYDESCEAFETLLPRYQEKMGDEHPACLSAMSGLGAAYILRGLPDGERGRRLLKNAYDLQVKYLGNDHRDTIWSTRWLEQFDGGYSGKLLNGESQNYGFIAGKGMTVEDRSDYMPVVEFSSTEQKFQFQLLKGTSSEIRSFNLETDAKRTNSLYGGLIHIAAYSNNLTLVGQLLERGVNMDESAGIFRTPMTAAAMQGNVEVLELLERHTQSQFVPDSLSQQSLDKANPSSQPTINPEGPTLINQELSVRHTTTINVEDKNLSSKDANSRLSSSISNKNPLEEAADKAHSSLILLMNGSQDKSLQAKYELGLEIFERMFTDVFHHISTDEGSLANQCGAANLSKVEWKYIEYLQARVVMDFEEPRPAYELRPPPVPRTKPNTMVTNGHGQAISGNTQISHPNQTLVLAGNPQISDIQPCPARLNLSPAGTKLSLTSKSAGSPPQATQRPLKDESNIPKATTRSESKPLSPLLEEASSLRSLRKLRSRVHDVKLRAKGKVVDLTKPIELGMSTLLTEIGFRGLARRALNRSWDTLDS